MAVETNRSASFTGVKRFLRGPLNVFRRLSRKLESGFPFASLTQRIVILNLFGFAILVSGILFLNQFRAGLIDAKVQSLLTQGEIIASAIGASAAIDTGRVAMDIEPSGEGAPVAIAQSGQGLGSLEFTINPERAAPELRALIRPTKTRARIYDRSGVLILDSETLYTRGQILRYDLPPPSGQKPDIFAKYWRLATQWISPQDLPLYEEITGTDGKKITEVASALTGVSVPIVRINKRGELIVLVAVPIQPVRAVLGVLLLSTRGGDIDGIVAKERWEIIRMGLYAAAVTMLLSILMAHTIAGPMRDLSNAAERVRRRIKARTEIPDYSHRSDEIGHLSGALRDMTAALYRRMDAIESFAADVSHELKNPLTSLRSAAETLPRVKTAESRERLMEVISDDVQRLDRLISDISNASRLDAELTREDAEPVDIADMLNTVSSVFAQSGRGKGPEIVIDIPETDAKGRNPFIVIGHDIRLGQVMTNLLDNAVSFSPKRGTVTVSARRIGGEIEIVVEDEGPGIPAGDLTRVFARFYTDRPGDEAFGKHSGLGLNISEQIVTAHGGKIWVENRAAASPEARGRKGKAPARSKGARFIIRLPAAPDARSE
ncbi:MAG: stimulus-sensing domain-containing protein [Alphaproteobacteria bacterium]